MDTHAPVNAQLVIQDNRNYISAQKSEILHIEAAIRKPRISTHRRNRDYADTPDSHTASLYAATRPLAVVELTCNSQGISPRTGGPIREELISAAQAQLAEAREKVQKAQAVIDAIQSGRVSSEQLVAAMPVGAIPTTGMAVLAGRPQHRRVQQPASAGKSAVSAWARTAGRRSR